MGWENGGRLLCPFVAWLLRARFTAFVYDTWPGCITQLGSKVGEAPRSTQNLWQFYAIPIGEMLTNHGILPFWSAGTWRGWGSSIGCTIELYLQTVSTDFRSNWKRPKTSDKARLARQYQCMKKTTANSIIFFLLILILILVVLLLLIIIIMMIIGTPVSSWTRDIAFNKRYIFRCNGLRGKPGLHLVFFSYVGCIIPFFMHHLRYGDGFSFSFSINMYPMTWLMFDQRPCSTVGHITTSPWVVGVTSQLVEVVTMVITFHKPNCTSKYTLYTLCRVSHSKDILSSLLADGSIVIPREFWGQGHLDCRSLARIA